MVVVAPFDSDIYDCHPLIISGTCKRETSTQQSGWLKRTLLAWRSPEGEATHGPVYSIDSDGDAKRRPALHSLCITRDIPADDPLYEEVAPLKLFNRRVGDNNETMNFDGKHLLKRMCLYACSLDCFDMTN